MRILVTGAGGFLGQLLARAILERPSLSAAGDASAPIRSLILTDLVAPAADVLADSRVAFLAGDLGVLIGDRPDLLEEVDAIVHLAAAVSSDCEVDLDLGLSTNIDVTRSLLQAARKTGKCPVFVYASSVAVFGGMPGIPLPSHIDDTTLPVPQSSYGIQKFIGEQLVADFTRRGFIRGRSVRLMTVAIRPGKPNGAASSFLSGMFREPLSGQRAVVPVPPETAVALASPGNTIEGLLRSLEADSALWGPRTALCLPALRTNVGEMAAALKRAAGHDTHALLDWEPDPRIEAIVGSWPSRINTDRARKLGLRPDASVDKLLQDYLQTLS